MKRVIRCGILLALIPAAGCLTPADRPEQLLTIARWQDQRLAPADSLRTMLTSGDAHVRRAALRAAGLIGRNDVLPQVTDALNDASLSVRAEAAWALGLIGDPGAVPDLGRAADDVRPQVRNAAVSALAQLENDGAALLRAAAHEDATTAALAWNGLRNQAEKVAPEALSRAIVAGLSRPEADVRWRVLRCAEQVPDSNLVPILAPFVLSDQAQIVVHAYRALARQENGAALPALMSGLEHLNDFRGRERSRVWIAACRALGRRGGPLVTEANEADAELVSRLAAILISAAGDDDPHVGETALAAMASLVDAAPLPPEAAAQESLLPVWRIRLARAARSHLAKQAVGVRAAALNALAALRGAGAAADLQAAIAGETSPQVLAAGMAAMAAHHPLPGPTLSVHSGLTFHSPLAGKSGRPINAMVRAAALTGLNEVRLERPAAAVAPFDAEHIAGKLLTATTDADFVVATTAAGLLGTLPSDDSVLALVSLWRRASGPARFELQRGVLAGLGALLTPAGVDSLAPWQGPETLRSAVRRVLRQSFDAADIRVRNEGRAVALATGLLPPILIPSRGSLQATLPATVRDPRQPPVTAPFAAPPIRCVSERGSFTIALDGVLAPNTCALFLALIRDDYFGAMTFHRVVPDFVVQGGDPEGNGWGGPGFTIRSEWSRADFARAAVGIAHDGKDTGGSQFFVTLSPQPHLNGRYTVFGRVSKGMDVVDRIQVGDTFRLELIDE